MLISSVELVSKIAADIAEIYQWSGASVCECHWPHERPLAGPGWTFLRLGPHRSKEFVWQCPEPFAPPHELPGNTAKVPKSHRSKQVFAPVFDRNKRRRDRPLWSIEGECQIYLYRSRSLATARPKQVMPFPTGHGPTALTREGCAESGDRRVQVLRPLLLQLGCRGFQRRPFL